MKLHGNAALSLNKRRLLCRRVVEEDWSLTEAAAAAEVSEKTAGKWVAPLSRRGRGRAARPLLGAALGRTTRTPEDRVQAIAALRRLRFTGAQIAELLAMPEKTVSGILTRIGLGRLGRLGLEPARRYERKRPGELIHVDVKKLGRIERGAGHRVTGKRRTTTARRTEPRRRSAAAGRLGVRPRRDRRRDPARLRRGARRREGEDRGRLPAPRASRFFRRHGIRRRAGDDRQRLCLPLEAARDRLPGARACATYAPGPRRPQTNGKAERLIRTMLGEWAYGAIYSHQLGTHSRP